MRKILYILLIIMLFLGCFKKTNNKNMNLNIENNQTTINFEAMQKLINDSSKMNIDVFFAISVLHKNYISQLEDQVKNMPEEKQKEFFQTKKAAFFKSIKYTEDEYNQFMRNNSDKMNDYISSHKEIQEYLTSY